MNKLLRLALVSTAVAMAAILFVSLLALLAGTTKAAGGAQLSGTGTVAPVARIEAGSTSVLDDPSQAIPLPGCVSCSGTLPAWQVVNPLPNPPAYGVAVASDGTKVYAFGGYSTSGGAPTSRVAYFTPPSGAWTTTNPLPPQVVYNASAVYAPNTGKIYVLGGIDLSGSVVNTTRIYNPGAPGTPDSWTMGAAMPAVRHRMAAGYWNGKVCVAGGYNNNPGTSTQNNLWCYDTTSNLWSTLTPIPSPEGVGGPGSGVIGDKFYVAGGHNLGGTTLNTLYEYDFLSNTWTTKAALCTPIHVPGSAVINGRLWLFGGENVVTPMALLQVYDPTTDTWKQPTAPLLNIARSGVGGTNVGTMAVAVGGWNGTTSYSTTEIDNNNGSDPCSTPTLTSTTTSTTTSTPTYTRTPPPPPTNTPTPPSCCGMDVAFVIDTSFDMGKMLPFSWMPHPLNALKPKLQSLIPFIQAVSSGDYRLSLITFRQLPGSVSIKDNWTAVGSAGTVSADIGSLTTPAFGIGWTSHASDVALNMAVDEFPGNGFGHWRSNVRKIIIFLTDAPPISSVQAGVVAHLAYLRDIHIVSIVTRALGPGTLAIPFSFAYSAATSAPFVMTLDGGTVLLGEPDLGSIRKFIYACADLLDSFNVLFEDVSGSDPYVGGVECLSAHGVVSGYPCGGPGEPCVPPDNRPYFRPASNVTRGQTSKIVATSAGWSETYTNTQTFADVPPTQTFYRWIEQMSHRGIISGYPCGGAGEPCDGQNRPYFRPGANVTRGQLSKIVVIAAGLNGQPTDQAYSDVPSTHTFYRWIEQLAELGVPNDYPCVQQPDPGDPCDADQRLYFHPGEAATREQVAQFVGMLFFPDCWAKP